ncbi:hypothetical protein M8A51_11130 [Schlegelella sp. S2-27]|uniref:3-oxoacyl-[acyl-carrier-protein] synthase-1 n=1 Tax=Caldimonas mangrovi TaxID=2944811 RepID=A0ABT0YPK7_9BURK|nr:hypothetical protein [Caldimonas mangrovi]MCM5680086.1 hypothetical protein [Caldimonas mangrovi]
MTDSAGEPMRVAQARGLNDRTQGPERYMAMLRPALDEALAVLPPACTVPLALGLPPDRPGRPQNLASQLQSRLEAAYHGRLQPVIVFELGHAATLYALDTAGNSMRHGSIPLCLVAGVDSYLDPETLEWLDDSDQLHGGGPFNNAWGFIPGEAAAAMLVVRPDLRARSPIPMQAEVLGVSTGCETKLIKTDAVCIGEGLTQAFRQVLQCLPAEARVDNIFCDMNGEAYRADEYGFTALRTRERFFDATAFIAPADCWGDVGAAGAVLHAAMAVACSAQGYGRGPLSLVWASSEGGERAAALIHAPFVSRE